MDTDISDAIDTVHIGVPQADDESDSDLDTDEDDAGTACWVVVAGRSVPIRHSWPQTISMPRTQML